MGMLVFFFRWSGELGGRLAGFGCFIRVELKYFIISRAWVLFIRMDFDFSEVYVMFSFFFFVLGVG